MDDQRGTFQTSNGEAEIGRILERARKEKGLTLEEVEHATKIRKRYLAGLESEDYGALPDAIYAHGFLKTYANYLGLDGDELSRELKDRRRSRQERAITYGTPQKSEFERPPISPGEPSPSRRRTSTTPTLDPLPRNKVVGLMQALLVLGALFAALVAFAAAVTTLFPGVGTGERPGKPPEGVRSFEVGESGRHTEENVDYAHSPPVGGPHDPVWQNCGFYTKPVRNENAVHSIEHGAVWIAYRPGLPQDQLEKIKKLVEGQTYMLASPYSNLPAPLVASAWGKQLKLASVNDPRLEQFVRAYSQGPQAPEPGAACSGGVGEPK